MTRSVVAALLLVGCLAAAPSPTAAIGVSQVRYLADDGTLLAAELYVPSPRITPSAGIIAIHGGGFENENSVANQALAMANAGFVVMVPHYRLAPAFRFPTQLGDVQAALEWLIANATLYGVDTARIGAWGPSAGGNLAYMLTTPGYGPVAAAAGWSGMTDLTVLGDQLNYFGCSYTKCPEKYRAGSPLLVSVGGTPTYIANSSNELIPKVQATGYAVRLASFDTPYRLTVVPGTRHGLALSGVCLSATIDFFRSCIGQSH